MMTTHEVQTLLTIGENIVIEFKRAGDGPKWDTYESICAFLNRNGGDVLLGVTDDGKVVGLPPKGVGDMVKSIVKVMNDPNLWEPRITLFPEVLTVKGKKVIHIHVPPGPDVYRFKGKCYDRVDDADVMVRSTSAIAEMFIRKHDIYTEQRVYPYVAKSDLRLDLLPRVRNMALSMHGANHPWLGADDDAVLRSAKLIGRDPATGKEGFNAAAVLLLGTDDCIGGLFPAYKTDCLLRRVNMDRYDDRVTVYGNLIEAYDKIEAFGVKHLDNKFFIENGLSVDIRSKILREMIGNTLAHREYTSGLTARFVIERDRMFTENANKAVNMGIITPQNLRPFSKNPIIANFFHQIGRADELGSGVRNLYHYVRIYSGADPVFDEGDIFRLTVPLDDDYSPEKGHLPKRGTTQQATQKIEPHKSNGNHISQPHKLTSYEENPLIIRLLSVLTSEQSAAELRVALQIKQQSDLQKRYLRPALDTGLIEYTVPEKPQSRLQKYRLTIKGRHVVETIQQAAQEPTQETTRQDEPHKSGLDHISQPHKTGEKHIRQPHKSTSYEENPQLVRLVSALTSERGATELREVLQIKHQTDLLRRYLRPAMDAGLIEYTIPDKPRSRLQKYRLTVLGRELL